MGIFDFIKREKKNQEEEILVLTAAAKGHLIPLDQVQDPVFSEGTLGQGCGIEPAEGRVYAPMDGEITMTADTAHAVGIKGAGGAELLIHVGIDTVEMNGDGFSNYVKTGDHVKAGQLLLEMDLEKIKEAGHLPTVITVVSNSDQFASVKAADECDADKDTQMMWIS